MTDALTRYALVGTSRQAEPTADVGGVAGTALAKLGDVPVERRVLLAAGARAVAAVAGRRSIACDDAVAPCPPETRPVCSPKAAALFAELLQGHHGELLPEALGWLAKAGARLPHALVPDALRLRTDALRAAARPVLGERGLWLAAMNEGWAWAAGATARPSLEELEAAWHEGTAAARRAILGRARSLDAARARAWVESTWSNERAEDRALLLLALRVGLSPDDEAFVEAQLRDRAMGVRSTAQALLACLAGSAFVRRMTERADAMLEYRPSRLAALGKRGSLTVRPPENVDADADRDGLVARPPGGGGAGSPRAFWLARTLAAVPLAHWVERFGLDAAGLVACAAETEWAEAVAEGWTRAALTRPDRAWLGALWDFWLNASDARVSAVLAAHVLPQIVAALSPADAAARVGPLLASAAPGRLALDKALHAMAHPWTDDFGDRFVTALHQAVRASPDGRAPLLHGLQHAALALPPACLPRALEPFDVPDGWWARAVAELLEVLRIRHDLFQEIRP